MNRPRNIVVIALVAATLCADRVMATSTPADSAVRSQTRAVGRSLVTRLSVSLRRVIPSVQVYEKRHDGIVSVSNRISQPDTTTDQRPRLVLLSPFQFRLPPPVL
jgi:hypothetical protein